MTVPSQATSAPTRAGVVTASTHGEPRCRIPVGGAVHVGDLEHGDRSRGRAIGHVNQRTPARTGGDPRRGRPLRQSWQPWRGLPTGRLDAFSDGVFAIAITLLVLEIGVPAGSEGDLLKALVEQSPEYLAYLVSFSTIGAVWFAHTVITEYLDHVTSMLMRLNLLLLMVVSFLPFPTRLLAEYSEPDDAAQRGDDDVRVDDLLSAAVLTAVLWRYALHAGLVDPDASGAEVESLTKQVTPGLAGYLVMIALGLLLPTAAVIGYLLLALYPTRACSGRIQATRAKPRPTARQRARPASAWARLGLVWL